jgi:adenylosuccinate synthase
VRYQGGSNAGHTVMFGGETYRLHLGPSGIFRPGTVCVVAHGVVVDPEVLFAEIDELRARPFPTEDLGDESRRLRDIGREYGTTTGRPRRGGWFAAVAVRSNGIDALALVKLDVLRGFPRPGIGRAYDVPSGRTTRQAASATDVMATVPVYRELPGFDEDVWGARRFDDLPAAARDFALAVEAECGVPVELVSVGPAREQAIRRARG